MLTKEEILSQVKGKRRLNTRIIQLILSGQREELRDSIMAHTPFLDSTCPIAQRIWHIVHDVHDVVKCKMCPNLVRFAHSSKGYQSYCTQLCASQDPTRAGRIKATSLRKYGVPNPALDPDIAARRARTNSERYGVKFPLQNASIVQNTHTTQTEKHGGVGFKSKTIQQKVHSTLLDRYGTAQGNHKSSEHISEEQYELLNDHPTLLKWHLQDKLSLTEIAHKIGISTTTVIRVFDGNNLHKQLHHQSSQERIVTNWLTEFGVHFKTADRQLIKPYEIDILVPEYKLAIEINGLWYHSERYGYDKNKHLLKTQRCAELGYRLIQLYDLEIKLVPNKCRALIQSALQRNTKIAARKLTIVRITAKQHKDFIATHHMQGACNSSLAYGLMDSNDDLQAVMSFGKSRFNQRYEYELLRYACRGGVTVVGGAARLFAHFIKENDPNSIVSYCDRRLFVGGMYTTIGFSLSHTSKPNYWYFYNNKPTQLLHRLGFQKHKLEKKLKVFDSALTEWQNAMANEYNRIWDCGNYVFVWKKS